MSKTAEKKIISRLDGLIEFVDELKLDDLLEAKREEMIANLEEKLPDLDNEDTAKVLRLQQRIHTLRERLEKHTAFLNKLTEISEQAGADRAEITADLGIQW